MPVFGDDHPKLPSLDELEKRDERRKRRQKSKRCQYPGCPLPSRHTHHLTYDPEVTTRLCKSCHEHITVVNTNIAHKLGRKLTNRERLKVWNDWTEFRVNPKMTLEALNWISRWH